MPLASALDSPTRVRHAIGRRKPVFFLDFDGTLAPLGPDPDRTELPAPTREMLTALAKSYLVCFASGRDLADLRRKIEIPGACYAADHGYRVVGPPGSNIELQVGPEDQVELEVAAVELERRLQDVDGALVEAKGQSLSVHYRLVAESDRPRVVTVVREVAEAAAGLRLSEGKLVHELRPAIAWGKGRGMLWLLGQLRLGRRDVCPVCLGDDLTDEDMFVAARGWGVTVIVGEQDRPTSAEYSLPDCVSAAVFLATFVGWRAA